MKALIFRALATLCATLALPASALADPLHLHSSPELTVSGGSSTLSRVAGGNAVATSTTGTGSFENTTTGALHLTFHHLTTAGAPFNCTTPGQPTGTVTPPILPFHLVSLTNGEPGILITPALTLGGVRDHFMDYNCGVFVGTVIWRGTGLLGTLTSPDCNGSSATVTLKFGGSSGVQEHTYDGTDAHYGLESSVGGGAYSPSAINAEATITLAGGAHTLTCT